MDFQALDCTNHIGGSSIELELPYNPVYVSSARLTASSIATHMGFDIEKIEEIESAISTACTYFIDSYHPSKENFPMFTIEFHVQEKELEIFISSNLLPYPYESNITSDMTMITNLMDDVQLQQQDTKFQIQMSKKLSF
ncbi:MAG: hypothetical protein GX347_03545 [Epulopiscium sp.]|nr:hypothetical protein [Candidatus Epulonipiscium sp.]